MDFKFVLLRITKDCITLNIFTVVPCTLNDFFIDFYELINWEMILLYMYFLFFICNKFKFCKIYCSPSKLAITEER